MIRTSSIEETRLAVDELRSDGGSVAFVPTMGYLHDGHRALLRQAHHEADRVVASIFVNPTQFAPGEDLERYPRDIDADLAALREERCDLLFTPETGETYPDDFSTWVEVTGLGRIYEGASRPTHFRGVTTVVAKLFNVVRPDVALFGRKDAQQVAVVRRMVRDLAMPLRIVTVPTEREADGLARSSRNVYLTDADRTAARSLSRALFAGRDAAERGEEFDEVLRRMRQEIDPAVAVDYIDIVDANSFVPLRARLDGTEPLAIVAARVGSTRLIDNLPLERTEV